MANRAPSKPARIHVEARSINGVNGTISDIAPTLAEFR